VTESVAYYCDHRTNKRSPTHRFYLLINAAVYPCAVPWTPLTFPAAAGAVGRWKARVFRRTISCRAVNTRRFVKDHRRLPCLVRFRRRVIPASH